MSVRSLCSMVPMAVRDGTFSSSPGIYGLRIALSHVLHGSPMWDAALSGFLGSRGIHSRRDVITDHADGAFTSMIVAASSVFAGVWYWMKDTNKSVLMGSEDPAMKTDAYLRTVQAGEDVKRAMASYNEPVVEEDIDDDPAMRAKFEDWMKKYGRTYKDEEEKARRFKIFKAVARSVDVHNTEAVESGSNLQFGLTQFADWNTQEISAVCCSETS